MTTPPPPEFRDSWARVFAYAWSQGNNDFLRQLNKDPRATIQNIVDSRDPESLVDSCTTILQYVNDPNSEEGFLALPTLDETLRQGLTEEQLYNYAKQDGLYGLLKVC